MLQLDIGDHRPLYEQVRDGMKELIISGAIAENERIPSVRELAQAMAINPNTIQKAYKELEAEGYIYSLRAKGSFAAPAAQARSRTDAKRLLSDFETAAGELFFLKIPKSDLIQIIDHVYEGRNDNDQR